MFTNIRNDLFTLIILLALSVSTSYANLKSSLDQDHVRGLTLRLCEEIDTLTAESLTGFFEPSVPHRFFTNSFDRVFNKFDFSYSFEEGLLLDKYSNTFDKTLEECWPDKDVFQFTVKNTIRASMYEGKLLGVLAQLGVMRGMSWVIGNISQKSKAVAITLSTGLIVLFGKYIYDLRQDDIQKSHSLINDDLTNIDDLTSVQKGEKLAIKLPKAFDQHLDQFNELLLENLPRRIELLEQKVQICKTNCGRLHRTLEILKQLDNE